MTKAELRKQVLTQRKNLTETKKEAQSQAICTRFFHYFPLHGVRFLHVFLSITQRSEVDTSPIIRQIWQNYPAVNLVIPKVDFLSHTMTHYAYTPQSELAANQWGIPEPVSGQIISPAHIDMVIVPLLAFDERGYRVGYGKGFYDRFLAQCRPDVVKVGVSFEEATSPIVDIDPYDIALNYCVTPNKVWTFKE